MHSTVSACGAEPVHAQDIARTVGDAVKTAATRMRPDMLRALEAACATERSERGREVLGQLVDNARIAQAEGVPLCQDTGTVWVWVELGAEETLVGDVSSAVDEAVARAYEAGGLRMSVVRDSLCDRTNTGTNAPAFVEITQRPGSGARVHVMLKGGGSDNASVVRMLEPAAGEEGIARVVRHAVAAKGSAACPPLVVGVGVGGTFDTVAKLSKKALLRVVGEPNPDPCAAELERRLLDEVNATGIGPGGLGGDTTAVAVHVLSGASHIAALPVAVNVGCCAVRSVSVDVG